MEEKLKSRWTIKQLSKYVKQQRISLHNSSLVLNWSSVERMKRLIDSYEEWRDEFVQLTLHDLRRVFNARALRLVGQLRDSKEVMSQLKAKYFANSFKASEV
jgi:hypothetical protein